MSADPEKYLPEDPLPIAITHLEKLLLDLMPEGKKVGKDWTEGSLSVRLIGRNAGEWTDKTDSEELRGSLIELIRRLNLCNEAQADIWLSKWAQKYAPTKSNSNGSSNGFLHRVTEACIKYAAGERNIKVAEIVLEGLQTRGKFYFNASYPDFKSAFYFDNETKILDLIHSDRFAQSISDSFAINRATPMWSYVIAGVENASLGAGSTPIEPEAFWASRTGAFYLSNGIGSIVKVTSKGPELVDNGTDGVLFQHGATLLPWKLTDPKDPFESCEMFSGINATANHGALLAKLWAISLPTTPKNKPPLVLAGVRGSGKTSYAKGICELYGFQRDARLMKVQEDGEEDFWTIMDSGGIVVLDNTDTEYDWVVDAIAAAATGTGHSKRRLYTDRELCVMRARSWVAVTSAKPDSFAGDPGLADRLLLVRMGVRTGDTKDEELYQQINDNRDSGLSWICCKLAEALASTDPVVRGLNRRHPDFGSFAAKLGKAIGREADTIAALTAAEHDKAFFCIENDRLGSVLIPFLEQTELDIYGNHSFDGTSAELLAAMRESGLVDPATGSKRDLTAREVGKKLEALWENILEVLPNALKKKTRTGVFKFSFSLKQKPE